MLRRLMPHCNIRNCCYGFVFQESNIYTEFRSGGRYGSNSLRASAEGRADEGAGRSVSPVTAGMGAQAAVARAAVDSSRGRWLLACQRTEEMTHGRFGGPSACAVALADVWPNERRQSLTKKLSINYFPIRLAGWCSSDRDLITYHRHSAPLSRFQNITPHTAAPAAEVRCSAVAAYSARAARHAQRAGHGYP